MNGITYKLYSDKGTTKRGNDKMFTQNWDLEEMFEWISNKLKMRNIMNGLDDDERGSETWNVRIVNMLSYEDEGLYDERQYWILEAHVDVYEGMEYDEFESAVINNEEEIQNYKTQKGWLNRYRKEVNESRNNDFVYHTAG